MEFAIGLLFELLLAPKQAPSPAPAVVLTAAQAEDRRAQALATPAASAEAAKTHRALVKHEQTPKDNTTLHRFTFPDGAVVEFADMPKRPRDQARRERVVFFIGTERAQAEPDSTFDAAGKAAGLSPTAIEALRFVSRHEGGFDAINTWDRARFSWGFIQFAGGYGFPPALAHFKASSPDLFRKLLGDYGIDALPGTNGPEPVYVRPEAGAALRGPAAEQAFGDDPLTIALFIRAGRVTEVKQRQVEAAVRDYAAPALTATFDNVRLMEVLRSPQSIAMLIDRQVHEGNVSRLEWALEHARSAYDKPNPADWPALEGTILDLAVQDADARARVAEFGEAAAADLEKAPAPEPALAGAREAMLKALYEVNYRMVTSYRRDELGAGLVAALTATEPQRFQAAAPDQTSRELQAVAKTLRDLVTRYKFEWMIRDRLRNIRTSELRGSER